MARLPIRQHTNTTSDGLAIIAKRLVRDAIHAHRLVEADHPVGARAHLGAPANGLLLRGLNVGGMFQCFGGPNQIDHRTIRRGIADPVWRQAADGEQGMSAYSGACLGGVKLIISNTARHDRVHLISPKMNRLLDFDLQARTELLAYLVASQLVLRQKTGNWLKAAQLIESTRLWLKLNGRHADWLQRVTLACRSQGLAEHLERTSKQTCDARTLARMFFGGVRLDLRSQAVIEIFVTCAANLPGEMIFQGEAA